MHIVEFSRPVFVDSILIQGLPGLGLVGKIAVDFLIDQLKPIKFAELYSSYITLPDGDVGVSVELNSTFSLPKYEFYVYTGRFQLILLTGDVQPNPWGQHNVANNVLDFVGQFGCKTLIALGGYAVRRRSPDVIYAVASEPDVVSDLGKKYNVLPAQSGMIKGAFGVMLGLGKSRNIKCLGLLGATSGTYLDLQASKSVLRLLSDMIDLRIDLNEMDKRIKGMESRMERFKDINQIIPAGEGGGNEVPRGYIS